MEVKGSTVQGIFWGYNQVEFWKKEMGESGQGRNQVASHQPCGRWSNFLRFAHLFIQQMFIGDTLCAGTVLGARNYSREISRRNLYSGDFLVVQWLGLSAFKAGAWVQHLVGELRSHMPCHMAKKKKKKIPTLVEFIF